MKKVLAILLAAALLACAVPVAALASSTKTVYVSSTGSGTLNLRSGPGKDYAVKGYVHHGDKVTPLDRSGEWSKIRTASGKTGWIKTKYIDGTTKALGTGTKQVSVPSGSALNLRSGPGNEYSVKGQVNNGATVKVLNTEDDWVKVTVSASGKTGWIMAKYIGGSSGGASGGSSGGASGVDAVYHVTAGTLNVRQGAGTGYGVIGSLFSGEAVRQLASAGNWRKVSSFTGTTGWVSANYLAAGATAAVTAHSGLNLRGSASSAGKLLRTLPFGSLVSVTGITGNWAKVSAGGVSGYASMNYLAF